VYPASARPGGQRRESRENRRLRLLKDTPGRWRSLKIFNGKELFSYSKYITRPNEFYIITNLKKISVELFMDMSWPRAQHYVFRSPPVGREQKLSEMGSLSLVKRPSYHCWMAVRTISGQAAAMELASIRTVLLGDWILLSYLTIGLSPIVLRRVTVGVRILNRSIDRTMMSISGTLRFLRGFG